MDAERLGAGGRSFDGRDVIDLKVGDALVAGYWIHVGYFDRTEPVICRDVAGAALIVGLLVLPPQTKAARDFGPHALVLQALVDAALK